MPELKEILHRLKPGQSKRTIQKDTGTHRTIIITGNRDFGEWPSVFTNPLIDSAAMDRLIHRGIKIVVEEKSYRLENFNRKMKPDAEGGSPSAGVSHFECRLTGLSVYTAITRSVAVHKTLGV